MVLPHGFSRLIPGNQRRCLRGAAIGIFMAGICGSPQSLWKKGLHFVTGTRIISLDISCESIHREAGANPARSRHCNRDSQAIDHWTELFGKAPWLDELKSGELLISLRCFSRLMGTLKIWLSDFSAWFRCKPVLWLWRNRKTAASEIKGTVCIKIQTVFSML